MELVLPLLHYCSSEPFPQPARHCRPVQLGFRLITMISHPSNGSQLSNQSVSVIISLLKVIVMTIYGIHHIMHWVHIRPVGVHLQEGQAERIPQPPQADCCLPWNTIRYLQKMRQLVGTISDGWEKDKYQMKTFTGWL